MTLKQDSRRRKELPGMFEGVISSWNKVGGYGLIMPKGPDSKPVFVHIKGVNDVRKLGAPRPGDQVRFAIYVGDERLEAQRVSRVTPPELKSLNT